MTDSVRHGQYLTRAIELAWAAREAGNRPFGAVLVDPEGLIVESGLNDAVVSGDVTGHSETNLVRAATRKLRGADLSGYTMYTSAEPCLMCAGAIYLSGIGRVVYALPASELGVIAGADSPVRTVPTGLAEALRDVPDGPEIVHHDMGEAASSVHRDFWPGPR
ncbi:nucleoside deaminase [Streptomyces sp. CA-106110]|uniref:nucleoside deaminase n=1 Tax=Streptomyces sp. CA-106110 TaxID=3240044 RepID=UPI003D8FA00F